MSAHDEKNTTLPVFNGGKDRSEARQILSGMGNGLEFRTAKRTHADGSETIVQKKGSMATQVRRSSPNKSSKGSKYRVIGERMFTPNTNTPFGAYFLDVDFSARVVTATLIPTTEYIGTDGTEKWKLYRRNLTWRSADGVSKVDYYDFSRCSAFGLTNGAGSLYAVYDKVPFAPARQAAIGNPSCLAKFTMLVSGVATPVLATEFAYLDAASGGVLPGYTYNPPPEMKADYWNHAGGQKYRTPEGRKIIYANYRRKLSPTEYTTPGVYVYDDLTETLTAAHVAEGGGVARRQCAVTITGYSSGLPDYSYTGAVNENAATEYPLSANFVAGTVIPITAKISYSSLSTSAGWRDNATGESDDTWWSTSAWELSITRGDTVLLTRNGFGGEHFAGGTGVAVADSMKAVSFGALHAPEQNVHAFVVETRDFSGGDYAGEYSISGFPGVSNVEVILFDFTHGTETSYIFPDSTEVLINMSLTTPKASIEGVATPDGTSFISVQSYDRSYVFTPYGPAYYPWNRVDIPNSGGSAFCPNVVGFVYDDELIHPFPGAPDVLTLVGALHASPEIIMLSVRNPRNPNKYMSMALDRKTKQRINFDHGFGFQLLYEGLKTLP